jgi:DNA-binding PadR family transcriptional regulator
MTERTITELTVLAMLGHVRRREVSGYDLKKFADDSLGYLWAPSKTQLYVVLRRLVQDGLVEVRDVRQADRPDKQLYRITAEGRGVVRAWLERDEDETEPDRSTFMLKFFFGRQAAPEAEAMRRQLAAFRDAYAERLAVYEGIDRDAGSRETRDTYTYLALQYGIARAQAAVTWADAAARELRRTERARA